MMNRLVFTLSDQDTFSVDGIKKVNLNDSSKLRYTFWHPQGVRKHMYITPSRFTDEALDLLYISLMVFYMDRTVRRDIQDDAWTRNIEMYIPVKAYNKWEACKATLKSALDFLTGDHWTIHFREYVPLTENEVMYRQGRYHFRNSIRSIDTDTFCMLSGGLDSFIGAINLIKEAKNPVFVSNYNGGKGVSIYQDKVVNSLRIQYGIRGNRFFRFYAAPVRGVENSTRSRSLIFFSHAIAVASGMGHHVDLFIPENGVISLNIPLTLMQLGSLSTRTTHPYYMSLLQKLITDLGLDIKLMNPFQFKTKGEMMKECKDFEYLKTHLKMTMSCAHPDQGRWARDPRPSHCGTCLPCTIRRAAIKAAELEDNSLYRDHNYCNPEASKFLKSYKLGLAKKKYPLTAIQMSGPIREKHQEYADLYKHGMKELEDFINSL